jgi:hypothetical protein
VDQPPLPEPPATPAAQRESASPSGAAEDERHPVLAVLVAVAALLAMGVTGLALTRPVPCSDRSFRSDRYGYCAETPDGWDEADPVSEADRFVLADGVATVAVIATRVDGSTDTAAYAERIRSLDEAAGFATGETKTTDVDGEPAVYFDAGGNSTDVSFAVREVVVVRQGVAWRITFSDVRDGFDEHFHAFGSFLDSWQFS